MHPKWIQIKHTLNEECIKCKILRKYFQKLKGFSHKDGNNSYLNKWSIGLHGKVVVRQSLHQPIDLCDQSIA